MHRPLMVARSSAIAGNGSRLGALAAFEDSITVHGLEPWRHSKIVIFFGVLNLNLQTSGSTPRTKPAMAPRRCYGA